MAARVKKRNWISPNFTVLFTLFSDLITEPSLSCFSMELITQIINFIYWYLKPLVKWFLRKTTRLCELQRVCYGELTGAPRTLAVGRYRAPIWMSWSIPTSHLQYWNPKYNIFFFLVSCIGLSEWLNIINKAYTETFYNGRTWAH